jgi:hypothetical protein
LLNLWGDGNSCTLTENVDLNLRLETKQNQSTFKNLSSEGFQICFAFKPNWAAKSTRPETDEMLVLLRWGERRKLTRESFNRRSTPKTG